MLAPAAVTVAFTVAELTINGPTVCPAGPVLERGMIFSVGGGGCTSGPLFLTSAVIASTASCSGSLVFSTYLSVKNQIAACTAAARWLSLANPLGAPGTVG